MYSLKIHKKALKFLKSRNASEKKIIKVKLNFLTENPYSHTQLDIKRLKGKRDLYRLRIGRIQVLYQILDAKLIVLVINAGQRGDIYKRDL